MDNWEMPVSLYEHVCRLWEIWAELMQKENMQEREWSPLHQWAEMCTLKVLLPYNQ